MMGLAPFRKGASLNILQADVVFRIQRISFSA